MIFMLDFENTHLFSFSSVWLRHNSYSSCVHVLRVNCAVCNFWHPNASGRLENESG